MQMDGSSQPVDDQGAQSGKPVFWGGESERWGEPLPVTSDGGYFASPVFSILTPSLNQARYLADALSSVRNQEQVRSEHIVIDGGSDDGTPGILESARGTIRHVMEPDDGQSDALNKGLALARGKIVGWLNADDFYLPGALAAVERAFALNPDVQVVYGDAVVVNESGCVIRGLQQHGFDYGTLLYYGCYIPSTATFFRSDLVESRLLHFDTTLHFTMDYELFLRLAAAGVQFAHLPCDLAAFRWHMMAKTIRDARSGRIEKLRVQRLYGAAERSDLALRMLHCVFQVKHGVSKLMSGAYIRQLRWRLTRGKSLRW